MDFELILSIFSRNLTPDLFILHKSRSTLISSTYLSLKRDECLNYEFPMSNALEVLRLIGIFTLGGIF